MSSQGYCTICSDNFVVSVKFITCGYCQKLFHPQCVKIKDALYKAIQDSENVHWFCDTCKPVVMDKLTSNLSMSPLRSSSYQLPDGAQCVDLPVLVHDMEKLVEKVVTDRVGELQAVLENEMLSLNKRLSSEVATIRDSNVDLIRLLTQMKSLSPPRSPPSASHSVSLDVIGVDCEAGTAPAVMPQSVNSASAGFGLAARNFKNKPSMAGFTAPSASGSAQVDGNICNPTKKHPQTNKSTTRVALTRGSGGPSAVLQPAPRGRNWIWVGGLAKDTSAEDVINHLKPHFPENDLLAFDLKSRSKKKSFKVGSVDLPAERLLSPDLWPDGVYLKPFLSFPRSQHQ